MSSLHFHKAVSATFALLLAAISPPAFSQSTKPPQQQLILVDPTPRQLDPHVEFSDVDSIQRARRQQAAALQRAQRREQVVTDTDQLLLLAQKLRDHVSGRDTSAPAIPDVMAAQKIEKLAKSVKDTMQLQ